jgi:hypothetical protein
MRRALTALVLATLMLVPAVAVPAQTLEAPQIEIVPDGVKQVLADYSRAFATYDENLLRQSVTEQLLPSELKALQNISDLTFDEFSIKTSTQYSGDLAVRRIRSLYPGREVATYHVIERTKVAGESSTFQEDGIYTFTRERGSDGWRLASKKDMDVLSAFSPVHLWDGGPVAKLVSTHFTLLTHPESLEEMRPVIDIAERAYSKVDEFWPRPLPRNFVIIAPSTTEELGNILHETVDIENFVAFVVSGVNRERGWAPTGPRVMIHLSHLRRYGADAQLEILAHELIHAVTRSISGPKIPLFVEEGLANAGGGEGGRPPSSFAGPAPDDFPTDEGFSIGPVAQIQSVYDRSQLAVQALIDAFGVEAAARFYETLGRRRVVPGVDEYHVRVAIDEATDWSYEEWLEAWRKKI